MISFQALHHACSNNRSAVEAVCDKDHVIFCACHVGLDVVRYPYMLELWQHSQSLIVQHASRADGRAIVWALRLGKSQQQTPMSVTSATSLMHLVSMRSKPLRPICTRFILTRSLHTPAHFILEHLKRSAHSAARLSPFVRLDRA